MRMLFLNPRKPNSAVRKAARVLLISTKKKITGFIPGESGNNLQKFSSVLVRGGRVKDLPGVKYKLIRGKYDLRCVLFQTRAKSKYGIRSFRKPRRR